MLGQTHILCGREGDFFYLFLPYFFGDERKFRKISSSPSFHIVEAAQIVFAFTPNSAAAERTFSLLKSMFGDQQLDTLADIIQTALMLRINERAVG